MKTCASCHFEKAPSEYYASRRGSRCKDCTRNQTRDRGRWIRTGGHPERVKPPKHVATSADIDLALAVISAIRLPGQRVSLTAIASAADCSVTAIAELEARALMKCRKKWRGKVSDWQ